MSPSRNIFAIYNVRVIGIMYTHGLSCFLAVVMYTGVNLPVYLPTHRASLGPADGDLKEIKAEMRLVLSTVKDSESNQESMRKSFDSKLDRMRNEFMATLDEKVQTLRGDIAIDISKQTGRIDQLENCLQSLQSRFDTMELTASESSTVTQNGVSMHT